MNFLAHIYLTMPDKELTVGNFVGDFVKGSNHTQYPSRFQKGILLHRKIDHYTDQHDIVRKSKGRLWEKYRHYASVIVDMFYDHLLANNWKEFSQRPLKDFTSSFYSATDEFAEFIPDKAKRMLVYMRRDDWLFEYRSLKGLDEALKGLSRRTPYESGMENASDDLARMYNVFREDFEEFFPDLISFAKKEIPA